MNALSAPLAEPDPDLTALRARTEALAAAHPLYPYLSGDAR
jgi:glycine hydroxymethyltransferase